MKHNKKPAQTRAKGWPRAFHLGIVIAVFLVLATVRLSYPELTHGDDHADASVLIAGKNFDELGFIKLKFLQIQNPQPVDLSDAYTHYPAGPELVNGLLRRILGLSEISQFRVFSLGISLLAVIGFWLFLQQVFSTNWLATAGTLFLACHPVFLSLFDSLHQSPYTEALRAWGLFTTLFLGNRISRHVSSMAPLIILWTIFFTNSIFTFETIVFLWGFVIFYLLLIERRNWREIIGAALWLASAPIVGVGLRVLNNAWYHGDFVEAFSKLATTALTRSTVSGDVAAGVFQIGHWYEMVILAFTRNTFFVGLPTLIALLLLLFAIAKIIGDQPGLRIAGIVALLCVLSYSWYFLMPAHTLAHAGLTWPQRHLLFPSALLAAAITRILALGFKSAPAASRQEGRFAVVAILPIVLAYLQGVFSSELPLSQSKRQREAAFNILKEQLLTFRRETPVSFVLATNYFRQPFISYYTDRKTLMAHNAARWEELTEKPNLFLFVPFNTPDAHEIARILENEGFRPSRKLMNQFLPIVVFEKSGG